jgi:hypothetical protein
VHLRKLNVSQKRPGANPTIVSYNASAVKKITTLQVAFSKHIFHILRKTLYSKAGVVVVNSKSLGLAPVFRGFVEPFRRRHCMYVCVQGCQIFHGT